MGLQGLFGEASGPRFLKGRRLWQKIAEHGSPGMKPYVVCHMVTSADGRILPRRWTQSPDGTRDEWTAAYGALHETL